MFVCLFQCCYIKSDWLSSLPLCNLQETSLATSFSSSTDWFLITLIAIFYFLHFYWHHQVFVFSFSFQVSFTSSLMSSSFLLCFIWRWRLLRSQLLLTCLPPIVCDLLVRWNRLDFLSAEWRELIYGSFRFSSFNCLLKPRSDSAIKTDPNFDMNLH